MMMCAGSASCATAGQDEATVAAVALSYYWERERALGLEDSGEVLYVVEVGDLTNEVARLLEPYGALTREPAGVPLAPIRRIDPASGKAVKRWTVRFISTDREDAIVEVDCFAGGRSGSVSRATLSKECGTWRVVSVSYLRVR